MRYINYRRSVIKDVRKLDKEAKCVFLSEIENLTHHSNMEKLLKGILKGYYSRAFSCEGNSYHIIYSYDNSTSLVTIEMVGSRENIYKMFKQRI